MGRAKQLACVLAGTCGLAAPGAGQVGPDLIAGELTGVTKFGTVGGVTAYAIGATACNAGTLPLGWMASTNDHPVFGQNLYRLRGGRFEQIGMSWVAHEVFALATSVCGTCSMGSNGTVLHPGCSTPASASFAGQQATLGPRSQVDGFTGEFPFPFTAAAPAPTIGRRLQVLNSDLNPALNPGAVYFGEVQYVSADDGAAGNGANNASHRGVTVGAFSGGGYVLALSGGTVRTQPAIMAWTGLDPGVIVTSIDVPGEGRFYLGSKATDLGDGIWSYEYALQNINSDRAAGSFAVPVPAGVVVVDIGFHDVPYHSGEPFDGTDWGSAVAGGMVRWATQSHAMNPNANALRWGTLYNFRFRADRPPTPATVTVGLFTPGGPASVTGLAFGPTAECRSDFNGDGIVNVQDFLAFLDAYDAGELDADFDGNGVVNVQDFLAFINTYATGC